MKKFIYIFSFFSFICFFNYSYADHIFLIPGAASSGGDIYIKNVSWIIKALHKDNYFAFFLKQFKEEKFKVSICPITPDKDQSSLQQREDECIKNIIDSKVCDKSGEKIHLIGHSLGGIVAKQVAQNPNINKCIKTVTSISSPHLGTPFADRAIRVYQKEQKGIIMERMLYDLTGFTPDNVKYLKELTTKNRENKKIKKTSHIKYFSIQSKSDNTKNPLLMFSSAMLKKELKTNKKEILNDGVVPTYSMYDGESLGLISADHWESACINVLIPTKGCIDVYDTLKANLSLYYKD